MARALRGGSGGRLAGKATTGLNSGIGTPGEAPGPEEEGTRPLHQANRLWVQPTGTRAKKPSQVPQPLALPGFLSSGPESSRGSSLTQRGLHSGKVWAKGRILSLGASSNRDPRGDDILSPEQTNMSTLQLHQPAPCGPAAPASTPLSSPTQVGARSASFWGLSTHQPCPRQTLAGEREREAQAWGGPCRGPGPSCGGCLAHLGQVTA